VHYLLHSSAGPF